jgi:hypothetical protein
MKSSEQAKFRQFCETTESLFEKHTFKNNEHDRATREIYRTFKTKNPTILKTIFDRSCAPSQTVSFFALLSDLVLTCKPQISPSPKSNPFLEIFSQLHLKTKAYIQELQFAKEQLYNSTGIALLNDPIDAPYRKDGKSGSRIQEQLTVAGKLKSVNSMRSFWHCSGATEINAKLLNESLKGLIETGLQHNKTFLAGAQSPSRRRNAFLKHLRSSARATLQYAPNRFLASIASDNWIRELAQWPAISEEAVKKVVNR